MSVASMKRETQISQKFFTLITDIFPCTESVNYVRNAFITWAPGARVIKEDHIQVKGGSYYMLLHPSWPRYDSEFLSYVHGT
jgi:hypothetical protein